MANADAALWMASVVAPDRPGSVRQIPDAIIASPAAAMVAGDERRPPIRASRRRWPRRAPGAPSPMLTKATAMSAPVRADGVLADAVPGRGQVAPQQVQGDDADRGRSTSSTRLASRSDAAVAAAAVARRHHGPRGRGAVGPAPAPARPATRRPARCRCRRRRSRRWPSGRRGTCGSSPSAAANSAATTVQRVRRLRTPGRARRRGRSPSPTTAMAWPDGNDGESVTIIGAGRPGPVDDAP